VLVCFRLRLDCERVSLVRGSERRGASTEEWVGIGRAADCD